MVGCTYGGVLMMSTDSQGATLLFGLLRHLKFNQRTGLLILVGAGLDFRKAPRYKFPSARLPLLTRAGAIMIQPIRLGG